jgi:antitoxin (DNA-binding transcriptional repressor) of toxin-antitoxin stability system
MYRKGKILITKAGKPVAALVDVALFERIRNLDEEFAGMTGDLARAFADVKLEKGMALVQEAATLSRRQTRKG